MIQGLLIFDIDGTLVYENIDRPFAKQITKTFPNYTLEWIKPLSKIWRQRGMKILGINKDNTIIVDDTLSVCRENFGNMINIPSYKGNLNDTCLKMLKEIFDNNKFPTSVRTWTEKSLIYKS